MNVCNIKTFVPLYIENSCLEKQKITIVDNEKGLLSTLPIEGKIHLAISKDGGSLSVKEICKKLGIKRRTARKCFYRLESKGLVRRKLGANINGSFRFGDKWHAIKDFELDLKESIYIQYKSKHRNNEKTHYILLPKSVEINEKFVRCIGLLDAEKTKFKAKRKTLEFVNSEPLMINHVLDFFEIFYIRRKYWKWRLIFNGNIRHLIENNVEKITNYWFETTGLDANKKMLCSPYFTKPQGSYKIKTKLGSLCLNYNNLLFHNFVENLSKKIKSIIIKNENYIWAYLSGSLCGEACVGKGECREIHMAFQDEKQLNFVKGLLNKVGIKTSYARACSTSPQRIIICSKDNFLKLYKKGVFDVNLKKKFSLINRLLSYKGLDNKERCFLVKDRMLIKNKLRERQLV